MIFHHDNLQSVLGLSGHEGSVLHTIQYDPFGNMTGTTGAANNNQLKFTGREADPDSGLHYYRARFYDPTVGRFIVEDPTGFKAGVNFYVMAFNNPINANDPMGLDWLSTGLGWGSHIVNTVAIAFPEVPLIKIGGIILSGSSALYAGYQLYNKQISPTEAKLTWAQAAGDVTNGLAGKALLGEVGETIASLALRTSNVLLTAKDTASTMTDSIEQRGISVEVIDFDIPAVPTPKATTSTTKDNTGTDTSPFTGLGGFLIYPNKPNMNMLQSVYAK